MVKERREEKREREFFFFLFFELCLLRERGEERRGEMKRERERLCVVVVF